MMRKVNDIINILNHYRPTQLMATPLRAAVMVIFLLDENDHVEIVVTKRSANLPTYAGHYSFPGGMADDSDNNLYHTAQRETEEELHLPYSAYSYIGELDDFQDHDGNVVRPFVVQMQKNAFMATYQISPIEIQEMYLLPIKKLFEFKDNPELHHITKRRPSYSYQDGSVFIWGLTAAILVHLRNLIENI